MRVGAYVHAYVPVCAHSCLCVRVGAYVRACVPVCVRACAPVCVRGCLCARIRACVRACVPLCARDCLCVRMRTCVCVWVHICTHACVLSFDISGFEMFSIMKWNMILLISIVYFGNFMTRRAAFPIDFSFPKNDTQLSLFSQP